MIFIDNKLNSRKTCDFNFYTYMIVSKEKLLKIIKVANHVPEFIFMQIPIFMATKRIELENKHLFRLPSIM